MTAIKSLDNDNVKFLCGLINKVKKVADGIDDLNVASTSTYSSVRITQLAQEVKHDLETYVQTSINGLTHLVPSIVNTLPDVAEAKSNTLYLIKDTTNTTDTVYNQYLLINGALELLGSTSADLDNVYTKSESDAKFALLTSLNDLINAIGTLADLQTSAKTSLVLAINEIVDDLDTNYIKKDNIVTTLDNTVTDEQVPSALATYNLIKDYNMKAYTDFSQISSTATTLSEYVQAMSNNSIASLNIADHTSEFMGDTEGIISNGSNIWGTLFIQKINVGRIYLRFNQIGGGYHKGTFEATCTATASYTIQWKKICTTSVADVKITSIISSIDSSTAKANHFLYYVKNGICYVTLNSFMPLSTGGNINFTTASLPKPLDNVYSHSSSTNTSSTNILFKVDTEGVIYYTNEQSGNSSCIYTVTFNYPVAE